MSAVVPGTWPAFPPAAVVAVDGAVLLLLQLGLRMHRRRGLPVALGVVAWLAFAVLAWAVAFAEAFHNLMRAVAVVLLILVLTGRLGR